MPEGPQVRKLRKCEQGELFPLPPHRWQGIGELEALGEECARKAVEFRDAYANDPRAARAMFNALLLFGTAEILRRRGYPHP